MKPQKIFNVALLSEGIVVIGLVIVWCNLVGYLRGYRAGLKMEGFGVQTLHGNLLRVQAPITIEEASG